MRASIERRVYRCAVSGLTAVAAALMVACGGGGGGSSEPPVSTNPTNPTTPTTPTNPTNPTNPTTPTNPTNPTGATPTTQGVLTLSMSAHPAQRVTLAAAKIDALPESQAAVHYDERDSWTSTRGGLVRLDTTDVLTLFDPTTLQPVGGFDLHNVAGANQPEFKSAVRLSPDGKLLLGYLQLNYQSDNPVITVLDLQGKVVQSGSPYTYDRYWHRHLFDWLPDGRYVYLAGEFIAVADLKAGMVARVAFPLPASITTEGGMLRASPDGKRLLLALGTNVSGTMYTLLYTVNIDGTGFKQLTKPSDRVVASGIRMGHGNATWSPDGKWIAFSARGVNPGTPGFYQSCQAVQVIPSDAAAPVSVDGTDDPADRRLTLTDAQGKKTVVEDCAFYEMSWQ